MKLSLKSIYIILLLLFSNFNYILTSENFSLIFPFATIEKIEPELKTSFNETITNEIMKNIFINEIFIKFEIGTPPQKIKIRLSANSNEFFIANENVICEKNYPKKNSTEFYYNINKSATFKYQVNKEKVTYFTHIQQSKYVTDKFIFYTTNNNNKIVQNMDFLLAERVNGPNHGIIGLKRYPYNEERRKDFFATLKQYNLTKNYIWYLTYDISNKNGTLFLGNYPHFVQNMKNKLYNLNHYCKIYSVIRNEKWDNTWGLNFNKIYLKNISQFPNTYHEILNTSDNVKNVILNPNYGIIMGEKNFKYILENNFLNKYLNNKICFQPLLKFVRNYEDKSYYYYYCKADYIEQMRKEFFPIIFEHKQFKFNFTFEFDDLFILKKNHIYLRIVFDSYSSNWIFGSPFFSKYSLFFDSDSKEISFYSPNIDNKIIENNNKINNDNCNHNNNNESAFKVLSQIFLGVILILIGLYLGKKIYGLKRKLRANELEEKFEYKPEEKQFQMY